MSPKDTNKIYQQACNRYRNTTDNNLQYWGLDYPPLTAYVSYFFGLMAKVFGQHEIIELNTSHGIETSAVKSFMRFSVLLCDGLFFLPLVWIFCDYFCSSPYEVKRRFTERVLGYPIDGIFQFSKSRFDPAQGHVARRHGTSAGAAVISGGNASSTGASGDRNSLSLSPLPPTKAGSAGKGGRPRQPEPGIMASSMSSEMFLLITLQPSFILIDHGHFQYNCVCHAFVVFAVILISLEKPIMGSIAYCCALNFKQMSLYYSPAFFFCLLSDAMRPLKWKNDSPQSQGVAVLRNFETVDDAPFAISVRTLIRVSKLGVAVIVTFIFFWFPFCLSALISSNGIDENLSCIGSLLDVLKRIFPFNRGLFEDKVANFWCSLSLVIKLRNMFSQPVLVIIAAACTLLACAPSCYNLMRRQPSTRRFLWALFNCSISFFLFSYQVHEKSILLPLVPASLLLVEAPGPVTWFGAISAFSMYPLLYKDGLTIPYFTCMTLFILASHAIFKEEIFALPLPWNDTSVNNVVRTGVRVIDVKYPILFTFMITLGLHYAFAFVAPPKHLPDLWTVAISVFSCFLFILAYIYGLWCQMMVPDERWEWKRSIVNVDSKNNNNNGNGNKGTPPTKKEISFKRVAANTNNNSNNNNSSASTSSMPNQTNEIDDPNTIISSIQAGDKIKAD